MCIHYVIVNDESCNIFSCSFIPRVVVDTTKRDAMENMTALFCAVYASEGLNNIKDKKKRECWVKPYLQEREKTCSFL